MRFFPLRRQAGSVFKFESMYSIILTIQRGKAHDLISCRKRKKQASIHELRDFLNLIKRLCKKPTANIMPDGEDCFPLKLGNKARIFILLLLVNTVLEVLASAVGKKMYSQQGCLTLWCLWATLEEELSWATH